MSREIKFRAWDKNKKKWYTRVAVGSNCCHSVWDDEHERWLEFDEFCGEVVQYTGLKDRNGKEIYEGDIIKSIRGYTAVVEWTDDGRFLGRTANRSIVYIGQEPAVEVIGNICDNPELLTA